MDRYRAQYDLPLPASFRKARTSASGMWSKALMSAPFPDLAGDVLVMEGMDFTLHKADPSVDLEHGRDPDVRGMPVAWMRESLSEPGAPYAVEWARLNFGGAGAPDDFHTIPVCTNFFDPADKLSSQLFALVEDDTYASVSVEFRPPRPEYMKSLGRSPLEPRDAYRFERSHICGLAICRRGVCPHAMTLTKSLEPDPQVTRVQRILVDGRINVGGAYEPLCDRLRKALAQSVAPYRPTVVRVEHKAMPMPQATDDDEAPPEAAPAPAADMDTASEEAVAGDAPASGGVAAKYAFAQAIMDACDQYEADMQSSDSPELRKMAEKFKQMAQKLAGSLKGAADKHDAKLNGGGAADDATDDDEMGADADDSDLEGDDDSDDDADAEDADDDEGKAEGKGKKKPPFAKACARDDDGVIVPRRPVYRKSLHDARVRRFSLGDLAPAAPPRPVKKSGPEPEDVSALEDKIERLAEKLKFL